VVSHALASLLRGGSDLRSEYLAGRPWPHLLQDGVISPALAASATSEVDALPRSSFTWQHTRRIQKGSVSEIEEMGPSLRSLIASFGSEAFLDHLRLLTGIPDLSGDPGLAFAGVYLTPPGGGQRVHEDFSRHPFTKRWNRVAVLLYLSDWAPGDGGELEMWGGDPVSPFLVAPVPGRLITFEPSGLTLHGVRTVCPTSSPRISLGMRYYSSIPPAIPPRPVYRQTLRRPGERIIDVLPTVPEVARMAWRLHEIRKRSPLSKRF
jgi:hypothetical protein